MAGYGEGGLLALTAAAVDTRIDLTFVDGYFGPREELWKEPIDRNLFGLLNEFGDAELAALIFPRELQIQFHAGPSVTLRTAGGAPGRLNSPTVKQKMAEAVRLAQLLGASGFKTTDSDQQLITGVSLGPTGLEWINERSLQLWKRAKLSGEENAAAQVTSTSNADNAGANTA